jgi:hypothetical protein
VDEGKNNGQSERPDGVQSIRISHDVFRHKFDMDLGGLALDEALSLLERAHRELEARYRFQRARELAAEAIQDLQTDALIKNAMRDPRIKA